MRIKVFQKHIVEISKDYYRVVKKFAWFPRKINGQIIWLEYIYYFQKNSWGSWKFIKYIDKYMFEEAVLKYKEKDRQDTYKIIHKI